VPAAAAAGVVVRSAGNQPSPISRKISAVCSPNRGDDRSDAIGVPSSMIGVRRQVGKDHAQTKSFCVASRVNDFCLRVTRIANQFHSNSKTFFSNALTASSVAFVALGE
jgi:hypothetical protein